jgi:integrase
VSICSVYIELDAERVLFSTFLLTGFREQEVMYLFWSDINLTLRTIRVTAKPDLDFLSEAVGGTRSACAGGTRRTTPQTPPPRELPVRISFSDRHREQHMLDRVKAVAGRAVLDSANFDLETFRSTYATRMLRAGFDVRPVQCWMGQIAGDSQIAPVVRGQSCRAVSRDNAVGHPNRHPYALTGNRRAASSPYS